MDLSIVIKKPIITEKSLRQAQTQNVYTFEVDSRANKGNIKEAVEKYLGVKVVKVTTLNLPGKPKRVGRKRQVKYTTGRKKAMIKVKKGQSIDIFEKGE